MPFHTRAQLRLPIWADAGLARKSPAGSQAGEMACARGRRNPHAYTGRRPHPDPKNPVAWMHFHSRMQLRLPIWADAGLARTSPAGSQAGEMACVRGRRKRCRQPRTHAISLACDPKGRCEAESELNPRGGAAKSQVHGFIIKPLHTCPQQPGSPHCYALC